VYKKYMMSIAAGFKFIGVYRKAYREEVLSYAK